MVIPRLERGGVNRAVESEVLPSGKGINCARATVRLGGEARALLFLGGDPGEWIASELAAEGIRVDAVKVPSPTRTCTTVVEQESGAVTELVESGGAVDAAAADAFADSFGREALAADHIIITGTLPAGVEEGFYGRLLALVPGCAARTVIDTQGRPLVAALAHMPFLAKPNRHEAAAATGIATESDEGMRRAIRALHSAGAVNVLVSDGPHPAWLSDGRSLLLFHPPQADAANPIGSGDCLAAGLVAGLSRGMGLADAARLGIACGTANAAGSGYARFDATLAERLMANVRVEHAVG
jgi:1-phosphofructokinase family hexose kinase